MLVIAQVVISVVLITLVLLQERGGGMGAIFGGGAGAPYQTRRGLEKGIFWGTIIAAVIFAALAIANLLFL